MKKIMTICLVALLMFSLSACTLDLGNGIYVNQNGIVKGSENLGQIVGDSDDNSQNSQGGTSQNPSVSNGGGNSTVENSSTVGGNSNGGGNNSTGAGSSVNKSNGGDSSANPDKNSTSSNDKPDSSQAPQDVPSGDVTTDIKPLSYGGLSESAYVTWSESSVSSAKVWYKASNSSAYTQVDGELVRADGSGKARVDILGLKAGSYDIRVHVGSANKDIEISNVGVVAYDRSGYAHFNNSNGVGAYNNDGTLKSGVKVVYVNESTKNSAGGVGLVKSIQTGNVCVRIIGRISCPQYLSANKMDTSITDIKNITRSNLGDDSYWNMIDVGGKSNITVEGVGTDAEFYQFGLTFKKCQAVEVRNLTFTNYPEDACSFEGDTKNPGAYKYFWIHNNLFNEGKNGWDLTSEQDKGQGDGASDIKGVSNVTYSYNKYYKCKKTGLIGGSDTHKQFNVTAHHNYYCQTYSRTPLGRQANMHYYNNYYENCGSYCVSLRATAYMFSEANYVKSKVFRESRTGGACKSFNDVFDGCSKKGDITIVTDRTKTVSNNCSYGSSFDTDASKFYYDSSAKKTKVSYLTDANKAKSDCVSFAGPGKANQF